MFFQNSVLKLQNLSSFNYYKIIYNIFVFDIFNLMYSYFPSYSGVIKRGLFNVFLNWHSYILLFIKLWKYLVYLHSYLLSNENMYVYRVKRYYVWHIYFQFFIYVQIKKYTLNVTVQILQCMLKKMLTSNSHESSIILTVPHHQKAVVQVKDKKLNEF